MAAFSGTAGSVAMATQVLASVSEWSLDLSMAPAEITAFGENWDGYVPSVKNATGTFMVNTDTEQTAGYIRPRVAFLDNVSYTIYLADVDAGSKWAITSSNITGMSPAISVKGKGEVSYSFTGSVASYS